MSMLPIEYKTVPVDFYPGREHKSDWFLKLNPLGQLPVIEDEGLVLRDAQAILVYLAPNMIPPAPGTAQRSGASRRDRPMARLCGRHHRHGFSRASPRRPVLRTDVVAARAGAHRLFRILDEHLWFGEQEGVTGYARAHPTVADIACFPYIMLSEEGGIPRQDYRQSVVGRSPQADQGLHSHGRVCSRPGRRVPPRGKRPDHSSRHS